MNSSFNSTYNLISIMKAVRLQSKGKTTIASEVVHGGYIRDKQLKFFNEFFIC